MVVRVSTVLVFITALTLCAQAPAQGGSLRTWVTKTEVIQDRPFWLFVEATGESLEMPVISQGDGLVINTTSPQQSRSFTMGGGRQLQTLKLSYSTTAFRAGKLEIPAVEVRVNGRALLSDPIVVNVLPAPEGTPQAPSPVRAWVSTPKVTVDKPFWIYLEATGSEITLPDRIAVDGLEFDERNSQRSSSFSFGRQGRSTTDKRGFSAIATEAGTLKVPQFEISVNGRVVKTEPIEITVETTAVASVNVTPEASETAELTQDDLVFIEMEADKREVYQGEPVLLTMQLWRIKYRRINSGPYRGGLIVNPTTEGFYVHNLDPEAFETKRGVWEYEVTETRKLLYPTRTGDLQIGQWHWEGIALINRQSIIARDKLYYKLDAGPIDIKVKDLPPKAPGFSGGVGEFEVSATLDNDAVAQGVPIRFTLTIRGWGNPDAIGAPSLPEMTWATVGTPDATHRFFKRSTDGSQQMAKYFTYPITPLQGGSREIPKFDFVYFDPVKGDYVQKSLGPYPVTVTSAPEVAQHLIVPSDVAVMERRVDILAEDIHSIVPARGVLGVKRSSPITLPLVASTPVLAYLGLSLLVVRRRRFATNRGFARAHGAKTKGLKRLQEAASSDTPEDTLYRAMVDYVADVFNLTEHGMTSADVRQELEGRAVDTALTERVVSILEACERARYASQTLSAAEIQALIGGAEACVNELRAAKRKRS